MATVAEGGSQRPPAGARVVAIGGGHGLARVLAALLALRLEPTAVATVADDGGSSGRLRRELGIIAPGDLRMALLTLARNRRLADVLGHRFTAGALQGHALGNLLLVALAEQTGGDFLAALGRAGELLECTGRVLPSTTTPVQLRARVAGAQVNGQVRVAAARGRVERVWLEPAAPPCSVAAADAVAGADLIVLGPGSLFTSVIASLLVPDLAAAVRSTSAAVVYVANILTQPGETAGLDAAAHVDALLSHVPGLSLDAVVLHDGPIPERALATGAHPIGTSLGDARVRAVTLADVATRDEPGAPPFGHDPARLARVLADLLAERAGR